jgi:DNA-binding NarL/FixJ family response regulator
MSPYTIVLADDHALFRGGVKRIIKEHADLEVIGEAGDGLELLHVLKKCNPNMVILDISMPKLQGLEATREIKKMYPLIRILLLTMHKKKEFIQQGIAGGADGFLLKEEADEVLLQAILAIRQGKRFISPLLSQEVAELLIGKKKPELLSTREKEVLQLLAEGKAIKDIADLLFISTHTVRRHRENIMKKMNFKGMTDLVKYAVSGGYISPD